MSFIPRSLKVNRVSAALYRSAWNLTHPRTRFIFVATTGRSATGLLNRVLSVVPGCRAEHEPMPKLNGRPMIERNQGDSNAVRRLYRTIKSVRIRRAAAGYEIYAETSHIFVKSFFEHAIRDLGKRLTVVHLRRDPVLVARSMAMLRAIPGTPLGNEWYLDWRSPRCLLPIPDALRAGGEWDDPIYTCLWYWYEIEARIAKMASDFPDLKIHRLSISDGSPTGAVLTLLSEMGLPFERELVVRVCDEVVNRKLHAKKRSGRSREELDRMHLEFRSFLLGRFNGLAGVDS